MIMLFEWWVAGSASSPSSNPHMHIRTDTRIRVCTEQPDVCYIHISWLLSLTRYCPIIHTWACTCVCVYVHVSPVNVRVWSASINIYVLRNLETALAGELGQMSLVNDYQTFRPNLGSSSVGKMGGKLKCGWSRGSWVVQWIKHNMQ